MWSPAYEGQERQKETDVKGGGLKLDSEPHISLLGPKEPPGALLWIRVLATSISVSMRLTGRWGLVGTTERKKSPPHHGPLQLCAGQGQAKPGLRSGHVGCVPTGRP